MNEFEHSRAYKSATECGNWKLKKNNKTNCITLEYWTIVKGGIDTSHSYNHNRDFQKTEKIINGYFIWKKDTFVLKDISGNYFRCPLSTIYRPGNEVSRKYYQTPTMDDLKSLLGVIQL